MQKSYLPPYYSIILLTLFFTSCSDNENEMLKKEKAEKLEQINKLKSEVSKIEARLIEIDSAYAAERKKSVLVSTILPGKGGFTHKVEARATVESHNNVTVGAESGGTIKTIHVREGQRVKKGQLLISLDANILTNSISELKTQLALATTIFEKRKKLFEKNIGTEVAYLQAKTNKEALEKKISTASAQRKQFMVYAPFSGVVDDIPAKVGQTVSAGMPILRIVNRSEMYVSSDVSEAFIGKFNQNDPVQVKFSSMDTTYPAKISAIGQVVNKANRTFNIEVLLPDNAINANIKPNMVCILELTDYKNLEALTVPAKLIQHDLDGEFIYIIHAATNGNFAAKKYLKTGKTFKGHTEIISGLTGQEKIIDQGYRKMTQNLKVSITDKRS